MQINIRQNGIDLPSVKHEGQRWFLAPPSGEYQIVLYNNSSNRRLAVVTVDSLSIIDGEDGSRDGGGYVLEPWETLVIEGWHRSDRAAAAFEFTPNGGSYVAKRGKGTRNTGVIAVAVFDEKPKPQVVHDPIVIHQPVIIERQVPYYVDPWWPSRRYPWGPVWCGTSEVIGSRIATSTFTCSTAEHNGSPADINMVQCSAAAAPATGSAVQTEVQASLADMDLGTAYGREVEMRTQTTTFERASKKPVLEIVIRYGTRERLAALGVPVKKAKAPSAPAPTPNPFPGASCPPPPGWSG